MTTPEFTLDWPYGWKTQDEPDVEIYCTDAPGPFPIHGRVKGISLPVCWQKDGRHSGEKSGLSLINRAAPTISVPVNKLHDGTMLESFMLQQAIIAPGESNIKVGSSRSVKWFYADEMENVK